MASNQVVYQYDQLGRLTNVLMANGAMATYTYDAMGNRTTVVEVEGSTPSCCPPTVTAFSKRMSGDFKNDAMVVMLSTGELIGWGDNTTANLANGNEAATMSLPQRLVFNPLSTAPPSTATIVDWVFTNANIFVVFSNGAVYGAGDNTYGQLGQGNTTDQQYLTQITTWPSGASGIIHVWASGGYSTTDGGGAVYFQDSNYKMYGCGLNTAGNLGNDTTTNQTSVVVCGGVPNSPNYVTNVAAVTADTSVSCYMLLNNGTVYVAGYNAVGQLGLNTTTNQSAAFVQAMKTGSVDISNAASLSANASGLSTGNALIVDTSGNVWTCGYNTHGELGIGSTTAQHLFTQVTALSGIARAELGGGTYGMGYALNTSGTLYTWGYNGENNLFFNDSTTPVSTPAAPSTSNLPSGTISKVFFAKGGQSLTTTAQMSLLLTNGILAFAGENVGQVAPSVTSGAYNLVPEPQFITDGTDSIIDVFVHGTGASTQRWFILTQLGNLYCCGDNTNAIGTGAAAGTTPAASVVWSRISFVL